MERVLHARNQSGKTGIFESEYRIFKSDGSVRWVHSRGFPIMDDNGTVYRMSGIAEDITDRKLELQKIPRPGGCFQWANWPPEWLTRSTILWLSFSFLQ